MWTNSQVFSKLKKKARDQNNLKASHFGDASLLVNSVSVLLTTVHISAIDLSSHIDQIGNIYLHINLLHRSVLRSTEFGCEITPVSRKMSLYAFQYKLCFLSLVTYIHGGFVYLRRWSCHSGALFPRYFSIVPRSTQTDCVNPKTFNQKE